MYRQRLYWYSVESSRVLNTKSKKIADNQSKTILPAPVKWLVNPLYCVHKNPLKGAINPSNIILSTPTKWSAVAVSTEAFATDLLNHLWQARPTSSLETTSFTVSWRLSSSKLPEQSEMLPLWGTILSWCKKRLKLG